MKSFAILSKELVESKFKTPKGHTVEKREVQRIGGEKVEITITSSKMGFHLFLNGQEASDTYKTLKDVEKDTRDVKKLLNQMVNEGITVGEIIHEINL
jgi:hypothetical protein